jgi:hypothetical protein
MAALYYRFESQYSWEAPPWPAISAKRTTTGLSFARALVVGKAERTVRLSFRPPTLSRLSSARLVGYDRQISNKGGR